jgi:hypothetical protein
MSARGARRHPGKSPFSPERSAAQFGLVVFVSFSLILVMVGAAAIALDSPTWFELLKAGFYVLGASVTTVIGYYFGSKGAQEREARALEREAEAEEAKDQANLEQVGADPSSGPVQGIDKGPAGDFPAVRPPRS